MNSEYGITQAAWGYGVKRYCWHMIFHFLLSVVVIVAILIITPIALFITPPLFDSTTPQSQSLLGTHMDITDIFSFPGTGDITFSLRNTIYQNNSLVTLEDIGVEGGALLCITDLTTCCRPPYTGTEGTALGNWFFPNGTRVPSQEYQWDFYRDRKQMVVQMNRRRGGKEGVYCCEIPDSMNVTRTIYIGVYTANSGK